MRKWINRGFHWFYRQRQRRIERFIRHPHQAQRELWKLLIEAGRHTEWGILYDYRSVRTPEEYARRVPVQSYEDFHPYIERMMLGEKDVLWNGSVRWFSKSSGTTSTKSKYIPVSQQNLRQCHIRGTWDTMTLFYQNRPDARLFELKSMLMGGSLQPYAPYPKTMIGDVSAIMIHHMPMISRPFFTPDLETALLADWEVKLERLARAGIADPRVVMIGGVPTWTVVLMRRMLELTGKDNMLEIWPDFQGYIHGGVSFRPYREQFQQFFPSDQVSYQEIYNATEGYFSVQDDFSRDDMLLLLNNGIYFEFLPTSEWGRPEPQAIPLWEVEVGRQYAPVISTNSGLWRYLPGDTVVFTSTDPYRIRVTGRTKHFVNAFGEEVVVENTDKALAETCRLLHATVTDYTVAPIYFKGSGKGGHEWLIEFARPPADLNAFAQLLDDNLQKVNSDYEAKRHKDIALERLQLQVLPEGTFHSWLRSKGKIGGQHKVPRLANHREHIEEILDFLRQ